MRHMPYAFVGLLLALGACSASSGVDEPAPDAGGTAGGSEPSDVDAGSPQDAAPDTDSAPERPLICGDAGFCETKVPLSDVGLPLALRRVCAVGPNDAWSVTNEGYVLHYDGDRWNVEYRANHELYAVWATATSVWVGGEFGLLLHRSATGTWTRVEPGHVGAIRDIYGSADDDVWFPNPNQSVDHYDGTTLQNHPIDVPGLEITTVFGRPGAGTYAAGYVKGEVATEDMLPFQSYVLPDRPYLFELSTTNITPMSPSFAERTGLKPVSGLVTDAPDEERKIFIVADQRMAMLISGVRQEFAWGKYAFVGPNSATDIDGARGGLGSSDIPALMYGWNDIRFMFFVGKIVKFDVSRDEFTNDSLAMGYDFPARNISAAHLHSSAVWVVGNGFALKGSAQ